jgi:hypothetical protein
MDTRKVVDDIDGIVNDYANSLEPLQRKLYKRVSISLKELDIDDDGNIKRTAKNLRIINDVKGELDNVVNDPKYIDQVSNIRGAMDDVNELQNNYFNKISDVAIPAPIKVMTDQAFDQVVDSLAGSGINENVLSGALDIVNTSISEGGDFFKMSNQLKDYIIGSKDVDGKLVSYSKQIVSDTIHGVSRNYNSIMTDKLGLQWYRYIGSLMDTSRPFCKAMVKKQWIHDSELAKCAKGDIDGMKVSTKGMMKGTNGDNIVSRCGGFNCTHQLVPVPDTLVPSGIRKRFEKSDNESTIDSRPRHK